MYAHRFLKLVTILTLVAVAAALLLFQFGGTVLRQSFTPSGNFEKPSGDSGPDYSLASAWIARPEMQRNASSWLPDGAGKGLSPGEAAIFYIHPTTYLRGDRWNAPLYDPDSGKRGELFVQTQASAFNTAGRVWAPRYRQAAYGAFLLTNRDSAKALDLAFSDLKNAFDLFLAEAPPGSPIILAGHSQGALHLVRLIRERKAQMAGRLVAAYAVGWPIDVAADLPALGIGPCRTEKDFACLLSWMSFADPPNPDLILNDWAKALGLNGTKRNRDRVLCVNPISGRIGNSAPPSDNPGTLVPNADFTTATLVQGIVGASCDKGLLVIDGKVPPLGPYVLPGNNYHVYDYALFWGAVRRDSQRRLQAWRR